MSAPASRAELVLVSTPIGNLGDLSPRAVDVLRSAALICCEDTRRTGRLLAHAGIKGVRLAVANEHTEHARAAEVVGLIDSGHPVAMVTDAGTPGVSDPGSRLVRAVLDAGHRVSAVPGPTALVMALVVSGFDTSRFVFEGFLPRAGRARRERLDLLAGEARTSVFYEAPHRIMRTIADLAAACGPQRHLALSRELTKVHEDTWRGTLAEAGAHLAATPPRGEYVVVLKGAPRHEAADVSDEDLRAALVHEIAGGTDRRGAVTTVTGAHRVPRRRVYEIALTIPRPG